MIDICEQISRLIGDHGVPIAFFVATIASALIVVWKVGVPWLSSAVETAKERAALRLQTERREAEEEARHRRAINETQIAERQAGIQLTHKMARLTDQTGDALRSIENLEGTLHAPLAQLVERADDHGVALQQLADKHDDPALGHQFETVTLKRAALEAILELRQNGELSAAKFDRIAKLLREGLPGHDPN